MTVLSDGVAVNIRQRVTPPQEPLDVVFEGLEPAESVRISAKFSDDEDVQWVSQGHYVADAKGLIELSSSPITELSEPDPHYLLWSASPQEPDLEIYLRETTSAYGRPFFKDLSPISLDLEVAYRTFTHGIGTVQCQRLAPNVSVREICEGPVVGRFFQPEHQKGNTAVLTLAGSGGGIESQFGPAIASLGYPVLSAALFAYPNRPEQHENIALDDIAAAINWLCRTAGVSSAFILGSSRGSEAAMLTAIHFPDQCRGVIAVSPGSVVTGGWTPEDMDNAPAWTLDGVTLPYISALNEGVNDDVARHRDPILGIETLGYNPYFEPIFTSTEFKKIAGIPVERLQCPLMLLAGTGDILWPSSVAARELEARIPKSAANAYRLVMLEGAGHFISPANTSTALSTCVYHPVQKQFYSIGGAPHINAKGNAQAWRALKEFILEGTKSS